MVLIIYIKSYIYIRMTNILTPDEIKVLDKIEREKTLHAAAQKNCRKRRSENDPQYREKLNQYMKNIMKVKRINMN